MPETFPAAIIHDVSSYFSSLPARTLGVDDVGAECHLKFKSFDCVPDLENTSATKTLDIGDSWSSTMPIALFSDDLPGVQGEPSMPSLERALSVPQVEGDDIKQLSRSAPTPASWVPQHTNTTNPSLQSPDLIDLTIPSFRREISFVGSSKGFDLFSPDGDWEDEQLPTVLEREMKLDFHYEQRVNMHVSHQAPTGLDFHDFGVGVSSSTPLGNIPMASNRSPVLPTDQFKSLNFNSPMSEATAVKTEQYPLSPLNLHPDEVTVKLELFPLHHDVPEEDRLERCFQIHDRTRVKEETSVDDVVPEYDTNLWDFDDDLDAYSYERQATVKAEGEDPPSPTSPDDEDNKITIGTYTRAERRRKILRFKEKRLNRSFTKKIMYSCRKQFADKRPRVGGRFIAMKNKKKKKAPKKPKTHRRAEGGAA